MSDEQEMGRYTAETLCNDIVGEILKEFNDSEEGYKPSSGSMVCGGDGVAVVENAGNGKADIFIPSKDNASEVKTEINAGERDKEITETEIAQNETGDKETNETENRETEVSEAETSETETSDKETTETETIEAENNEESVTADNNIVQTENVVMEDELEAVEPIENITEIDNQAELPNGTESALIEEDSSNLDNSAEISESPEINEEESLNINEGQTQLQQDGQNEPEEMVLAPNFGEPETARNEPSVNDENYRTDDNIIFDTQENMQAQEEQIIDPLNAGKPNGTTTFALSDEELKREMEALKSPEN